MANKEVHEQREAFLSGNRATLIVMKKQPLIVVIYRRWLENQRQVTWQKGTHFELHLVGRHCGPAAQLEKRQQALSATVLIALPFSLEAWRQLEYAHNLIGTTL